MDLIIQLLNLRYHTNKGNTHTRYLYLLMFIQLFIPINNEYYFGEKANKNVASYKLWLSYNSKEPWSKRKEKKLSK